MDWISTNVSRRKKVVPPCTSAHRAKTGRRSFLTSRGRRALAFLSYNHNEREVTDLTSSPLLEWGTIQERTVIPGFRARFAHSERMTFVLWNVDADAILPRHVHPHEQVTQVQQGTFELTIEGEALVLGPGTIAVIAPNRTHSGRALTACQILDVFSPVRDDYRENSFSNVLQGAIESASPIER